MADYTQIPISSSIQEINPALLFDDGFELENSGIVPAQNYSGSFTPGINQIEFYVYDSQKFIQYSDYNFTNYQITENSNPAGTAYGSTSQDQEQSGSTTNIVNLNPEKDIYNAGYTNGVLYGVYNFVNLQLSSSNDSRYYISEISGDRTEIRLKSNYIDNDIMQSTYIQFETLLGSVDYFDEFYITFGQNEYHIGINSQFVPSSEQDPDASILIKLFDALPGNYKEFDEVYVVTKTAETQVYEVDFVEDLSVIDDTIALKGPNTNLKIKDFINNSTTYKSKEELLGTKSTGSKDQLLNVLKQKGIKLTPNYSTSSFEDFVNFSSAKQRTQNFYEKVCRIQAYEADIAAINPITGSNPTPQISKSIASLYTKIEEEIAAFDGWDYYLYYNTASDAYPKDVSSAGTIFPYPLLDSGSTEVLNWLGSDVENNQYYGGVLLSASLYDNNNQNWLYYTIPSFITEQSSNDNYVEFCNMVGQSFDELWLYTKTITAKLNTTNVLDEGVPLSLADDVITSLGYSGFGNNYNNQDNFIGLVGNDNGMYVPPTGSELINNYIAINLGDVINYWDPNYSWENYVEQLILKGFPYPIDDVSKEIFKRLYHNMAYLVKKKGTTSGLRQLINIWGIPNTILRINEFGGKNKDETDDYDLWFERYSFAFTPVANSFRPSASCVVPWMPLERNRIADGGAYVVPDSVAFRFKTTGNPSSSYAGTFNTQSLLVKKSNGLDDDQFDWGISLNYTGSTSGSYSGSGVSDYYDWAEMRLYISGAAADGGNAISDPIYLPFYDKGWWSVMVQRDQHTAYTNNANKVTYTLYAKNKIYNGWDGNSIGFEGSSSIEAFSAVAGAVYGTGLYGTNVYGYQISESLNYAWNKFGTTPHDGVYVGGRIQGAQVGGLITNEPGKSFSGSLMEFRYYSNDISESVFNDFVMNPESVEGNEITGSESSFDIVNFRAPLGNELENFFTSSWAVTSSNYTFGQSSSHPAFTASAQQLITGSFVDPNTGAVTSSYSIEIFKNASRRSFSKPTTETYFMDQPSIGFRNRISQKIQNKQDLNFGTVLSGLVSIEKDPFISQSYTENLNQLTVAFSPQDEVNDDIISSLGYGSVQEAIADPRFRSSSEQYYPALRNIAKNYFKKYVGSNVYDYLRLIKYFDDSLFKAIKNYVPARTSVSTGIVIQQNMLERNRYREPQATMVTTQSYAITNIPLTTKNLEITSSIDMYDFTGSAGGSVNKYNITGSQSGYYGFRKIAGATSIPAGGYLNLNQFASATVIPNQGLPFVGDLYGESNSSFSSSIVSNPLTGYCRTFKPVKAHFSMYIFVPVLTTVDCIISSSIRGEIYHSEPLTAGPVVGDGVITPLLDILPEESLAFYLYNSGNNVASVSVTDFTIKTYDPQNPESQIGVTPLGDISSSADPYYVSSQGYIEYNSTNLGMLPVAVTNQEEFYDGEFSGSTFDASTRDVQYNPYLRVPANAVEAWSTASVDFTLSAPKNWRIKAAPYNLVGSITTAPTTMTDGFYVINNLTVISGGGGLAGNSTDVEVTVAGGAITTLEVTYSDVTMQPGVVLKIPAATLGAGSTEGQITLTSDDLAMFHNIQANSFEVDNSNNPYGIYITGQPTNILNNKDYVVSFYISDYTGPGAIGFSQKNSELATQMWANSNIGASGAGPWSASLSTAFVPAGPPEESAAIYVAGGVKCTMSNFNIAPDILNDPTWDDVSSYIYLNPLQQDQWQIQNTQSIIFANSDYNPLNNNVSRNRSSSTRILLSYNDEQFQPENFQQVVTYSINNTSQSLFADVPDSNYTQLVSINPRYRGSRLESLDYNNYHPSGTVGVVEALPVQPYSKGKGFANTTSSIADKFINGTASFGQNDVNPDGSGSWGGDISYGKSAVIDKHPMYIAHFKDSFEQYNYWDTVQYNIDQLIYVPTESISGKEYTPITLKMDGGTNLYKKYVSSTFEPERKMAVSYNQNINPKVDYTSQSPLKGFGSSYDIGGGSIRFLTLHSNSQTRLINAPSWSYNYKKYPTGSNMSVSESMMITGSTYNNNADNYVGFLLSGSQTDLLFNKSVSGFGRSGWDNSYFQATGPQLAVYHTYNTAVARQYKAPQAVCVIYPNNMLFTGGNYWVNEGQRPSDPQNYFMWDPTGSDCGAYQDSQLPWLIQRGDIVRVEGSRQTMRGGNTSSIDFIQEYTIMEMVDYWYSSSYQLASLSVGNITGDAVNTYGQLYLTSTGNLVTDSAVAAPNAVGIQVALGTGGAMAQVVSDGTTITQCYVYVSGSTGDVALGTSPANYAVGQTYDLDCTALGCVPALVNITLQVPNMKSEIQQQGNPAVSVLVSATGSDNNFTMCNTDVCGASPVAQCYAPGTMAVEWPTFISTDRDPKEDLFGIIDGVISRYTFRRQIEDESSVMAYNVTPPSGSQGISTPSGDGFLIPDDLSQTQKDNALNIVNQLRQKNAFPEKRREE
jgi:hypothetical protein